MSTQDVEMNGKRVKPEGGDEATVPLKSPSTGGKPAYQSAAAREAAERARDAQLAKGVSFSSLYREADGLDRVLLFLGFLGAVVNGAMLPAFTTLFSRTIDAFGSHLDDPDKLTQKVNDWTLLMFLLGCAAFAGATIQMWLFQWSGMRQAARMRVHYLTATLAQNIEFFDKDSNSGSLLQGLSEDIIKIQAAIGDKCANFVQTCTCGLVGIIIAFANAWDVALVMGAMIPLLGVFLFIMDKTGTRANAKADAEYADANEIATESISNVKTVAAFNAQSKIVKKYSEKLRSTVMIGVKTSTIYGVGIGLLFFSIYAAYALAFWYGAMRIREGKYDGAEVLSAVFGFIVGAMALAQAAPNLPAIARGRAAGGRVFRVLDMVPTFSANEDAVLKPMLPTTTLAKGTTNKSMVMQNLRGEIELRNVKFSYPTRPDQVIFEDFNLRCEPGTTTALVGSSGSGKSTVVSLLVRFYDPMAGSVLIDGEDLRSLSLGWYRQHIGLVSQEPTLFATTIAENIAFGAAEGAEPTREEIEEAAKAANAHSFIKMLPQGYDTVVGDRGGKLSGGQRQRIAIARAILRAPRILLLDEATSALDTASEALVQGALDRLMHGRTTIVVAHRLSTVQDADAIAVVRDGAVVEKGSHSELINRDDGAYRTLVQLQLAAMGNAPVIGTKSTRLMPSESQQYATEEDALAAELEKERLTMCNNADEDGSELDTSEGGSDDPKSALAAQSGGATKEDKKKKKKKSKDSKEVTKAPFGRLMMMNKPEWPFFAAGAVFSIVLGLIMPAFALIMSEITTVFYNTDHDEAKKDAQFWSLMFVVIGLTFFVCTLGQQYSFGVMGHNLASRVRVMLIRAVLFQDAAFFDIEENSAAAIATRLGEDALVVRGAVGDVLGAALQSITTLIAGITLAFVYAPKMAAVVLSTMPLVIVSAIVQQRVMLHMGDGSDSSKNWTAATSTAGEAIRSIRTVQAFGLEARVLALYRSHTAAREKLGCRSALVAGLTFGVSQFIMFNTYALAFWYGGLLVRDGLSFNDMLTALLGIVFAAFGAAQAQISFPDVSKAGPAASRVFEIINRKIAIDAADDGGDAPRDVPGALALSDVDFAYPTRKEVQLFKRFTIDVPEGRSCALVGESGSGKSTIVNLAERLYDPDGGDVCLDGVSLKGLNVAWLRSQMGLVSQEPMLLSGTVLDNILLGMPDGTPLSAVEDAARVANAYDFVSALPEAFNTKVGEGGIQLSGGQKQRIAIARAVIRNPRVLLLDEATSALDAASEKEVQLALDKVSEGRTTIIVAHRLSTIRNANSIAVVQSGKILERGTHEELMQNAGGAYTKLVRAQMSSRSQPNLADLVEEGAEE